MAQLQYLIPKDFWIRQYLVSYASATGEIKYAKPILYSIQYPSHLSYLIFSFKKNTHFIKLENQKTYEIYDISLIRHHNSIASLYLNDKVLNYFVVFLKPNMVYDLFGVSPNNLPSQITNFADIGGKHIQFLYNALANSRSHFDRVSLFESYIKKLIIMKKNRNDFLLNNAITNIFSLDMKDLEKQTNCSRVWINDKIKTKTGMGFQTIKNLKKFNYSLQRINIAQMLNSEVPLSQIALESKYYDQNHFIKSFKRYTGKTPKQYINECNDVLLPSFYLYNGLIL